MQPPPMDTDSTQLHALASRLIFSLTTSVPEKPIYVDDKHSWNTAWRQV